MFRATGAGKIEEHRELVPAGVLKALLYNFDFDDFADNKYRELKPEHQRFLKEKVVPLLSKGKGNIWMQGSASQIGADSRNMILSQTRVGRVANFLSIQGIDGKYMQLDAIGEEHAKHHSLDDERDRGVLLWVYPRLEFEPPPPRKVPPMPTISRGQLKKLYVYDRSSFLDRMQAFGRFDANEVVTLAIDNGIEELKSSLDSLLEHGQIFNRALFQTHGMPGGIWFGNEVLTKYALTGKFIKYAALFPSVTRIYFDGCNVAEGEAGTNFLLAAGNVFLSRGGGEAVGWITLGTAMPGLLPFIGGHTVHFGFGNSNNVKKIRFFPGGSPNFPDSWIPAG